MGNKTARAFAFFYTLLLHSLVFVVSYFSSAKKSTLWTNKLFLKVNLSLF